MAQFNFVGLIFSSDLKWHKHIEHISLKISKVIGIMYRIKSILQANSLLKMYNALTLSGPGYLMSLKVRGGGTCAPPLISKSTNSILRTLYATLYKNCCHYRSAICFKIGLGLAEIIRCLCTKVVFL